MAKHQEASRPHTITEKYKFVFALRVFNVSLTALREDFTWHASMETALRYVHKETLYGPDHSDHYNKSSSCSEREYSNSLHGSTNLLKGVLPDLQ